MRRLILFDIDGTLLAADGAGARALRAALHAVYGSTGATGGYSFAGRTDPEIVRDLLRGVGRAEEEIEAGLERLWPLYLANLQEEVRRQPVHALPGVPQLVERAHEAGGEVLVGLLTGNLERGARIKVEAAGLDFSRFRVGAFGSDHAERPELPAIAVQRAWALTGVGYRGKEVVIIGDTPRDVACGAHLGVRTIATATGSFGVEALAQCGPDHLFADLSDVDAAWEAITAG
jgi:phosphoglycolate phosphatase-like HAD superfamily hydrolase